MILQVRALQGPAGAEGRRVLKHQVWRLCSSTTLLSHRHIRLVVGQKEVRSSRGSIGRVFCGSFRRLSLPVSVVGGSSCRLLRSVTLPGLSYWGLWTVGLAVLTCRCQVPHQQLLVILGQRPQPTPEGCIVGVRPGSPYGKIPHVLLTYTVWLRGPQPWLTLTLGRDELQMVVPGHGASSRSVCGGCGAGG